MLLPSAAAAAAAVSEHLWQTQIYRQRMPGGTYVLVVAPVPSVCMHVMCRVGLVQQNGQLATAHTRLSKLVAKYQPTLTVPFMVLMV